MNEVVWNWADYIVVVYLAVNVLFNVHKANDETHAAAEVVFMALFAVLLYFGGLWS